MKEVGIKPELEVFDSGMVNVAKYLGRHGFIGAQKYFNIFMGNLNSVPATIGDLASIATALPDNSIWAGTGLGVFQLPMNVAAIVAGGRVHDELKIAKLAQADETGINVDGKRHWLHCMTNDLWTSYFPHKKRGTDVMNDMGILPEFKGTQCHDHWKPYFIYNCTHALCNAHHLRELERAWEQDEQQWAKLMKTLLEEINSKVIDAGGALNIEKSREFRETYRKLLKQADIECPESPSNEKGKRGRVKRSKSIFLLVYQNMIL